MNEEQKEADKSWKLMWLFVSLLWVSGICGIVSILLLAWLQNHG